MQHIGRNTMGRSFPRAPPARLPMLNMTLGKPDFDHKYNILPDISGLREQMEDDSEYEEYNTYGQQAGEAYNPYGEQAGEAYTYGEQAAEHHWHSPPVCVGNQHEMRGMRNLDQAVPREVMGSTQREFMGPIHREFGAMMPINRAHEPMMPIKRDAIGPIRRESDPMLQIKRGVMGPIRRESDPMMPIKRETMGPIRRESDPMLAIKREAMGPIRRESDPMMPIKREAMCPIRRESEQLIDGFYHDAHGDAFGPQRTVPQNNSILSQPVLPKPGNEFAPMKNDVISNVECLDRTFIGGNVRDLSLYGTKNILPGICKSGDSAQLRDQVKNGGLMKRVESSHALNMGMARESAPLMAIKPTNMQEKPDCENLIHEGQGQIRIAQEKLAQILNEDTPKHNDNLDVCSTTSSKEGNYNEDESIKSPDDERMVSGHFDDSVKVDRREKLGIESPTDSNKLCAYETSDDEYSDIKDDKDMRFEINSRDIPCAEVINPQRGSMDSVNQKVEIEYETEDDDGDGQSCKTESKHESENQWPQADEESQSEDEDSISYEEMAVPEGTIVVQTGSMKCVSHNVNIDMKNGTEESISYEEMPVPEGTIVVQTGSMKCVSHNVDIEMENDEEESISYEEMPVPEGTLVVQTGNMTCVRHDMEAESESDEEESISYEEMPVPEGTIVVQTGNMRCVSHDVEINSDEEYMETEKSGSDDEKIDIRAKDVTNESGQTGPTKGIDKESGVRNMDTIDIHKKVFGEYANLGKDPVHKMVSEDVDIKEDDAQEMPNDFSYAQPSSLNSSNKRSGIVVIAKEPDAVRRKHRKRKQERDDRKKSVEKAMAEETKSETASSSIKSKPKVAQSKPDVVSDEKPKTVESKSEQMSNETDDDIENISDKILDQESESSAKHVSESKENQINAGSSKKVTFNRILAVYTFQPDSCSSSDSSTIKCRNGSSDGDAVYGTDDEIDRVPNEILDEPVPIDIVDETNGEKQDTPKQCVADEQDIAKHVGDDVKQLNEVTESKPAEPKAVHVTYEKKDASEMDVADVLVTSQDKDECIKKVEPVHGVSHIHVHIHISHHGNDCSKKSNEIAAKCMPVEAHEDLQQVVDDMRITKDKNGGKQKRLPPFDLAYAREGRCHQKRERKGGLAKPNSLGPDRNIPNRNKRYYKRGDDIVAAGDSTTGSLFRNRQNVEHKDERTKLLESPANARSKQRHTTNTHKTNEQCFKPFQKNHIEPFTSESLRSEARTRLMEILDVDGVPDRVATTLLGRESVTAIMNEYNTDPLQYGQHYLDLLKLREEKPYVILSHYITDPSRVEDNRPWNYYDRLKIYELSSEYRNGRNKLDEKLEVNEVSLNEKAQTDVNRDEKLSNGSKNKRAKKNKQKNKKGSSEGGQRRKFSLKSFFRRLICVCKQEGADDDIY